ncbi:MAG: hypothetical protein A2622_13460 [Bdellovibrionales bacterium RIFCSPHIGHO2_01_FULL_40_29]|nr:MAG: hypothetical protein A2622_13460 [Bdellovibrionales bacterium RIFCSPHIGHO2_01_FULL_40_29]OFZ34296.1 MAG: hypothetical protein A3D17_04490 [Bdellovibrionales bacterium RIFCSPHIGHO2_02_FULL_40_15]
MKTVIIAISLFVAQVTFAQISGSKNEIRHQDLMTDSIFQNCGPMFNLVQVAQTEKVEKIDQGVQDVKFTTLIVGTSVTDQMNEDTYEITIESEFTDAYDHSTQTWGSYSISSISCVLK